MSNQLTSVSSTRFMGPLCGQAFESIDYVNELSLNWLKIYLWYNLPIICAVYNKFGCLGYNVNHFSYIVINLVFIEDQWIQLWWWGDEWKHSLLTTYTLPHQYKHEVQLYKR